MASSFKYATETELRGIFPEYASYNPRKVLRDGWTNVAGDVWKIVDVGIVITAVWFDETKGTKASSSGNVDSVHEWYYDAINDDLWIQVGDSLSPIEDEVIMGGSDNIGDALSNSSMELSGMLDGRYPRPIPKTYQEGADSDSNAVTSPEYDYLIVRATCLLTAKNLIRSVDATSELAQAYYSEVTNETRTGIVDKLNDGEYKLNFEIDRTDSSGNILQGSDAGTMDLVETFGEYTGAMYDRIKIVCTMTGAYGLAEVKVYTLDNEGIFGNVLEGIKITGGFQLIGGIWMRFEGKSMTTGDEFLVEVRNTNMKPSNSNAYSVGLSRR